VSLEYTGTATNGTDYVASSMTISIPAGDLTRTVTIDPTADLIYEGNETVSYNCICAVEMELLLNS
jgi:hypothetical protein